MKFSKSDINLLIDDLYIAALKTNNLKTYCDYAFRKANEYVHFDSASLNLCVIKEDIQLTELKCLFYKQPQEMESSYSKSHNFDFFTPVLINNRFHAFHAMELISIPEFHECDLFLKHCRKFEVNNSIAVGSKIPGHKYKFMIIYFYYHEPYKLFSPEELFFLESIFPPFFTAMRYELNLICAETMRDEIMAVKSLCVSQERMRLVRYILNNPTSTRKEIAKKLNKSISTIDTQLQSIFDTFPIRKEEKFELGKWNLKCQLLDMFTFLK